MGQVGPITAARRRVERLRGELEQAERELNHLLAERARSSRCEYCGGSPGRYVCSEADRGVFACSNYVAGDDQGDPTRARFGYVRP